MQAARVIVAGSLLLVLLAASSPASARRVHVTCLDGVLSPPTCPPEHPCLPPNPRKQEPAVAPVVLHSWLRSRDVFQIDPALKRSPIVLPGDECGQRRERLEALGVGAPVLEMKTYCMWLQTETKRGRRQLQERAKNPPRSDLTTTTGKACASSPGGQEQRNFGPTGPPSL